MDDMQTKPRKQRLPVHQPIPEPLKITPNRRQNNFMEALAIFHYLTAEQLSDVCGYSRGTLPTTRVQLSRAFHARYLRRVPLLMEGPFGSSPLVYALSKKGYAYLAQFGKAPEGRFRSAEESHRETPFLKHTLAANAFLIRAIMLVRAYPTISLGRLRAERELKRKSAKVQVQIGPDEVNVQTVRVVPDGWVELQFPDRKCELLLELDRGTIDKDRMKIKIQALLLYAETHYRHIFQAEHPIVVFVTTAGQQRLENIVKWTEDELERRHAKHKNGIFRFAAFNPHEVGPEVFFSPIWIGAFNRTPMPLFKQ